MLSGTYQNFRPNDNPDQLIAYGEAIGRMITEFGQGRTAAAILKACDLIPDFVPTPAKIREFIPPLNAQIKTCTLCHPTGWVLVFEGRTAGGNKIDPRTGAVRKCDHQGGFSPVVEMVEGQREYGVSDTRYLAHIHAKARKDNGNQPLSEKQLDGLIDELDRAIDSQEEALSRDRRMTRSDDMRRIL